MHLYKPSSQAIQPPQPHLSTKFPAILAKSLAVPQGHLDEARELRPKVPAEARPLLLPAVACGQYLDALQRAGFDPFAPALQRGGFSPLWHQLAVKWRLLRGEY